MALELEELKKQLEEALKQKGVDSQLTNQIKAKTVQFEALEKKYTELAEKYEKLEESFKFRNEFLLRKLEEEKADSALRLKEVKAMEENTRLERNQLNMDKQSFESQKEVVEKAIELYKGKEAALKLLIAEIAKVF